MKFSLHGYKKFTIAVLIIISIFALGWFDKVTVEVVSGLGVAAGFFSVADAYISKKRSTSA
jgi:uncharacterized membrane protein